jgi:hypothetical protein
VPDARTARIERPDEMNCHEPHHDVRSTYGGRNVGHHPIDKPHDLGGRIDGLFSRHDLLRRLELPDRPSQSRESLERVRETRVFWMDAGRS